MQAGSDLDSALIDASRRGDRAAYGQIIERYHRAVYAMAFAGVRDRALSDDITQDTFVLAWSRLADLRDTRCLAAWLCGIARNLGRDARKRQCREAPHDDAAEQIDATTPYEVLTARSRGTVNINTAPAPVLSSLGLSDAEISNIIQERTNNPYPTVPGRFGGRRVTVGSTTFRIDADGIVGGEPKARIVAIVQKSAGGTGTPPTVTVVSWRPMPLRSPEKKESSKS